MPSTNDPRSRLWHLTASSANGMALFTSEAATRRAVRRLIETNARGLSSFNLVDTHGHLQLESSVGALANRKRSLTRTLSSCCEAPLGGWHTQPVESGRHARSLVDYHLKQPARHGLTVHPALWSGSAFQDFVRARFLVDFERGRIFELHRRLRLRDMLTAVGLPPRPIAPIDEADLRSLGPDRLVHAASAALAAEPGLQGRRAPELYARGAVAVLGRAAGLRSASLADALGASVRTVQRLARGAVDERILRAVRVRLALEESVRQIAVPAAADRRLVRTELDAE